MQTRPPADGSRRADLGRGLVSTAPQDHQEPGHFSSDDAVVRLLWLAICTIEDKQARDRAQEAGLGRGAKRRPKDAGSKDRSPPTGSKALAQLALVYPERLNPYP